ncbi:MULTISPECIES: YifB family Mg chelatase-like AAA ATPase [unclassified Gilliamella]|uniref:YifB family Mg chelatase-like AAA ATPase n=1 Tax=unclassified Gilliamella TaxID=2685620 RepID=UPI001C69EB8E|nr:MULTISPECIES: YifB family Mg chelatase-like AAA ATPase [unclassified Gilliamella]MCX8580696.1 YifB family Mg chelatase-like AAA ATPase [Gilliamella sp. B3482]MCX8583055.1 YifB family Mg chelatase-like AAA ATPase [Gilliamella sp. B3372]MCX8593361.1 YifB family Mg chelatase-like AAA ATPase [Gilliamella sp. B3367]MCX8683102.1 YifB family Mg chelatase-like AAA ATPase [Gilliamella sp. B2889]QYN42827.1 YifB family Mg chelatase-like AAA ATPase [Gilliamella sp. ESL0443]
MSLAIIYTRASIGIQAPQINVEVHISNGLPGFVLVGLPEATVKESKDRVRSAIINSGFTFPAKKITVNLSPADLPKEGSRFDLPIAIAILAATEQIPNDNLAKYEFLGELALSGEIKAVKGAIPAAISSKKNNRTLIISRENQSEISLIHHNNTLITHNLLELCQYLYNEINLPTVEYREYKDDDEQIINLQDIIGQEHAKRALEIAAAGGHNLLLIGPPGTGKTMLATRLTSLLPSLSDDEALESAAITSLVSANGSIQNWRKRPFRAPHHSASAAALVGGGSIPKPGEISLAHNGVLFLDELPEFNRKVLDALREPIESGEIVISRANAKIKFPAKFQLIAAMNPSPTGHYHGTHNRTTPQQIIRYLNRLSGPFLDRFDISIEVPLLPKGTLSQKVSVTEPTDKVKKRVMDARKIQMIRNKKLNSQLSPKEIQIHCLLTDEDNEYLEQALIKLGLSARAWHRILKVSRTIADLDCSKNIERKHISEALSYRSMDRLLIQMHKNIG